MKTLVLTAALALLSVGAIAQEGTMNSKPPAEKAAWMEEQTKLKNELLSTQSKLKSRLESVETKLAASGDEAKPKLDGTRTELKQASADVEKSLSSVTSATSANWTDVQRAAMSTQEKAKATLDRIKDEPTDAKTPEKKEGMK